MLRQMMNPTIML